MHGKPLKCQGIYQKLGKCVVKKSCQGCDQPAARQADYLGLDLRDYNKQHSFLEDDAY